jgi:hypothetical protein
MFKIAKPPYINWAAAQQIQFHPFEVDQDFDGSRESWARNFLHTYCESLEKHIASKIKRLEYFQSAL